MTTRYVGSGGNDSNTGLSWAQRKLTINGIEDTPVVAGDQVWVGPGTYRESLTCDVSGTSGNVITYIADTTGANTDGVGGQVRITGSDNDIATARANCINVGTRAYRTFTGFTFDLASSNYITSTNAASDVTIKQCIFYDSGSTAAIVNCAGASQLRWIIDRCVFFGGKAQGVYFNHSAAVDNAAHIVRNCLWTGGASGAGPRSDKVGGITVVNCSFLGISTGVRVGVALTVGQTITVNNCIFRGLDATALQATTSGEIVEDYNSLFNNATNRSNTATGSNSNTRPYLPDMRPFIAMILNGGTLVSPFDLASYCTLVELNSGSGAPSTDIRGASQTGSFREWGATEYNSALSTSGGGAVRIRPGGGRVGV